MWSEKSSNVLWILILNTKDVKFINAVMLKSRGKLTTGLKLRMVKSIKCMKQSESVFISLYTICTLRRDIVYVLFVTVWHCNYELTVLQSLLCFHARLWPGKLSLITHAESKPDLVHNVTQRPLCGLQPVSIQQWGLFPGTDKK